MNCSSPEVVSTPPPVNDTASEVIATPPAVNGTPPAVNGTPLQVPNFSDPSWLQDLPAPPQEPVFSFSGSSMDPVSMYVSTGPEASSDSKSLFKKGKGDGVRPSPPSVNRPAVRYLQIKAHIIVYSCVCANNLTDVAPNCDAGEVASRKGSKTKLVLPCGRCTSWQPDSVRLSSTTPVEISL
ncbi:uncharacterized protein [Triticum aestivum]|uniref:uncharacterized protein isoform X4 n=1 Tax=Triticum aestivum TaxID=4565 RepID=UPI001D02508D|nr:uncharacterized protein LOC123084671 isoform X4 [Triticum aestivum]